MLQTPVVTTDATPAPVPSPQVPTFHSSLRFQDEMDIISPEYLPSVPPFTPATLTAEKVTSEQDDDPRSSTSSRELNPNSALNQPLPSKSTEGPSSPPLSPPSKQQKPTPQKPIPRRINFDTLPPEQMSATNNSELTPPPTATMGNSVDGNAANDDATTGAHTTDNNNWQMILPSQPPTLNAFEMPYRQVSSDFHYQRVHNSQFHANMYNESNWRFTGVNIPNMPLMPPPTSGPDATPPTPATTQPSIDPPTYYRNLKNAVEQLQASFNEIRMNSGDTRPPPPAPPSFVMPPYNVDPIGRTPLDEQEHLYYIIVDHLPENTWAMQALVLQRIQHVHRIVPMDATINRVGCPFLWIGLATIIDAR